jgi:hypothetical protein
MSQKKQFVVNGNFSKYDVYIGRPSKFGNPFFIGKDGTREEVIAKYRALILSDKSPVSMEEIKALKGKVLACHCAPLACHGDVLAEIANDENS